MTGPLKNSHNALPPPNHELRIIKAIINIKQLFTRPNDETKTTTEQNYYPRSRTPQDGYINNILFYSDWKRVRWSFFKTGASKTHENFLVTSPNTTQMPLFESNRKRVSSAEPFGNEKVTKQ